MKLARILTGKGIGMVLPALGLGSLLALPAWGQTTTVAAAPPATATSAPLDVHAASAGSMLKNPAETNSPQMVAAVTGGSATGSAAEGQAWRSPAAGGEVRKAVVEIENLGERLAHLTRAERQKWTQASAALPAFCHDWDRMLHDREVNNLSHLEWHERDGYKTATYTGYGQVQACQAKESDEGVPIGKVTYQEMNYYLAGKSENEAKSHPKLLGTTNTLEIFSWEKDRWFY